MKIRQARKILHAASSGRYPRGGTLITAVRRGLRCDLQTSRVTVTHIGGEFVVTIARPCDGAGVSAGRIERADHARKILSGNMEPA